jgi:hypothetical protein
MNLNIKIKIPRTLQLFLLSTICLVLGGLFLGWGFFNSLFAWFGYIAIMAGYVMSFLTLRRVGRGPKTAKPEAPRREAGKQWWE